MMAFDYEAPAELFLGTMSSRNAALKYRRFETAAQAIQFAIESGGKGAMTGTVLEVDEDRFDMTEIRRLYQAPEYPYERNVEIGAIADGGVRASNSGNREGASPSWGRRS